LAKFIIYWRNYAFIGEIKNEFRLILLLFIGIFHRQRLLEADFSLNFFLRQTPQHIIGQDTVSKKQTASLKQKNRSREQQPLSTEQQLGYKNYRTNGTAMQ
jgi:hypothetical protein